MKEEIIVWRAWELETGKDGRDIVVFPIKLTIKISQPIGILVEKLIGRDFVVEYIQ